MKKTPFWRRRLVVNWSLQARYAVVLTLFSAFSAFALGFFALRAYADLVESPSQMSWPIVFVALWGVAFTVAATTFGLVVSNRWAGPLFRMERYLRQMADGGLPVIHPPRKGDELHALFSTFRAASEALRTREQRELETLEGSLRLLEQQNGSTPQEVVTELRGLAERKRASLIPEIKSKARVKPAPMPRPSKKELVTEDLQA